MLQVELMKMRTSSYFALPTLYFVPGNSGMGFSIVNIIHSFKNIAMTENIQGQNSDDRYNKTKSSLGSVEGEQQNSSLADSDEIEEINDQADSPLSQSSANEQDNDEQSKNQSATSSADKNRNIATSFHDNTRTTGRANEADDRLDTGSGGLSAGGVKSATDL